MTPSPLLTPPQAPPTWKHTVQDVDKLITQALEKRKRIGNAIVKLPEDKFDFDNVSAFSIPPTSTQTIQHLYLRCL